MGQRIKLSAADLEGAQPLEAPPRRMKLSAADLEGAQPIDDAPAPGEVRDLGGGRILLGPEQGPSQGEAALRGVGQGATARFADELVGGARALAAGGDIRGLPERYRKERDAERARNKAAEEAHPKTYLAGELGGAVATSFIPGMGIARGATLAAGAARAGAQGAVAGLGGSEADLTKGEVGQAAEDALTGGAVGAGTFGALKGAGRLVRGAPARVENRILSESLKGVPGNTQTKALERIGGRDGLRAIMREDAELAQGMRAGADDWKAVVTKRVNEKGQAIGEIYAGVDKGTLGVRVPEVLRALHKVEERYARKGDTAAVKAIRQEIEGLRELWGNSNVVAQIPHVKATEAHEVVKRLGERGWGTGAIDPSRAQRVSRDLAASVRDVLQAHVKRSGGDVDKLRALNEEYGRYAAVKKLADARAKAAARDHKTMGDRGREVVQKGANVVGLLGAATGSPAALAIPVVTKGAPAAVRGADRALARLALMVRNGGTRAQVAAAATEAGIPRATAQRFIEAAKPDGQPQATEEGSGSAVAAR